MASGMIIKPVEIPISIKKFGNAQSITIELPYALSAAHYGLLVLFNKSCVDVFAIEDPIRTLNVAGSMTYTTDISGTTLTITPSTRLWGETIVLFSMI